MKGGATYFDLTTNSNGQIIALAYADSNPDPNQLITSLTMEDGSVWQQERPLDVVRKTPLRHYTHSSGAVYDIVSPYRFSQWFEMGINTEQSARWAASSEG